MSHNLFTLVWQLLKSSESKRDFNLVCSQLILIGKIWNYYPKEDDFDYFQAFISREIEEENEIYFNLLKVFTNFGPYKLTPMHFKQLTTYLFHRKHQSE